MKIPLFLYKLVGIISLSVFFLLFYFMITTPMGNYQYINPLFLAIELSLVLSTLITGSIFCFSPRSRINGYTNFALVCYLFSILLAFFIFAAGEGVFSVVPALELSAAFAPICTIMCLVGWFTSSKEGVKNS